MKFFYKQFCCQMEEPQINLSDSDQCMNESQLQVFLDVRRSSSSDSLLGQLINGPAYEKRSLVLDYNFTVPQNTQNQQKVKVFKPKIKKPKIKKECDYRKNICGYITKKIIREYFGSTYRPFAEQLCLKHGADYEAAKHYYLSRIQKITGPSHISGLVVPEKQEEVSIKGAFREFFIWFLKQRYLRYLLLEGKMDQKKAYIDYKNNTLMNLLKSGDTQDTSSSEVGQSSESLLF